jgi:hypothetical protein
VFLAFSGAVAMIAICPAPQSQIGDLATAPRAGSLRRIDDILAELLAGYASALPQPVAAENDRPVETAAQPERLMGGLVTLPVEMDACCASAAE